VYGFVILVTVLVGAEFISALRGRVETLPKVFFGVPAVGGVNAASIWMHSISEKEVSFGL